MALQYKLKAGGITNLTDARFFNALEADWLGFNLDVLAENSISLKEAQAIKGWLFAPKVVLECGHHQDKMELIFLGNDLEVEAVQVDCDHPILKEEHFLFPIMLTVDFVDLGHAKFKKALESTTNIVVIIIRVEERNFDWEIFKKDISVFQKTINRLKSRFTVLIEMPFEKTWFLEALQLLEPHGIHLSMQKEDSPGLSKVDVYSELLELIEVED
jgi:phosphoribosylanthranilate isomerase